MKSSLKAKIWIGWGLSLAWGWSSLAQSAPKDPAVVDLAPVLALHGEKVEDVTGVAVGTVPSEEVPWQQGLFADLGMMVGGSLGITPGGTDRSLRRSGQALEFKPGFPGIEAVHVASCRGGRCSPLPTDASGPSAVAFASEAGPVKAMVYSDLCASNARSCAVFMPSWALSKLLTSTDATLPRFPTVLLVAATARTLVLVDASTGLEWLSFVLPAEGESKSLGALQSAAFAPGGRLVLRFARAGMVLDFKQDLALLATAGGSIWLSSTGLGSGTLAHIDQVYDGDRLGSKAAQVLAMGPDFALTSNGVVRFALHHLTGFRLIGTAESGDHWDQAAWIPTASTEAPAKILAKESNGAASILNLALAPKIHWTTGWESPAPVAPGASWAMTGGVAVVSNGQGSLVLNGKESAMRGIASVGSADVLVERASSSVKDAGLASPMCEWVRLGVGGGDEDAAAERGLLRDDCKAMITFGVSDAKGSLGAVSYYQGKAQFQVWWANPAP